MSKIANRNSEKPLNLDIDRSEKSREANFDRLQQVQELLVGDIERSSSARLNRLEDRLNEQSQRIDGLSEQITAFQVAIYDEFATQSEENARNLAGLREVIETQLNETLVDAVNKAERSVLEIGESCEEKIADMAHEMQQETRQRSKSMNDLARSLRAAADSLAD